MNEVADTPTTPRAMLNALAGQAAAFLSPLALARQVQALDDVADLYDRQATATPRHEVGARAAAERGRIVTDDHIDALRALLLTVPARTLGDAAAQLAQAFLHLQRLEDFELDEADQDRELRAVRRALASALPLVAGAAGVTVAEVGGAWLAGRLPTELPAMELVETGAGHGRA